MDVLGANSGPAFLLVYAAFAAVAIALARRYARGSGRPAFAPPETPLVDVERDPFEVAYLRGGGGCMLRFAFFELVRRRALRIVSVGPKGKGEALEATGFAEGEGPGTLLPAIVAFAATPRTPAQLLASPLPARASVDGAAAFESRLVADGLLISDVDKRRARVAMACGALALIVVAGLRAIEALARGHHNLGFLLIETIFATTILAIVVRSKRVTVRGRAYLARIRSALGPAAPAPSSLFDPQPLFVAAVGFDVLAGTQYAPLVPFVRSTSSDGSCGSGGDSGGGDGGGGCGGGCGG